MRSPSLVSSSLFARLSRIPGLTIVVTALAAGSPASAETFIGVGLASNENESRTYGYDGASTSGLGVQLEFARRVSSSMAVGLHLAASYGSGSDADDRAMFSESWDFAFLPMEIGLSVRGTAGKLWGGGWAGVQNIAADTCRYYFDNRNQSTSSSCPGWQLQKATDAALGFSGGIDVYERDRDRVSLFLSLTRNLTGDSHTGAWFGVGYRTW